MYHTAEMDGESSDKISPTKRKFNDILEENDFLSKLPPGTISHRDTPTLDFIIRFWKVNNLEDLANIADQKVKSVISEQYGSHRFAPNKLRRIIGGARVSLSKDKLHKLS